MKVEIKDGQLILTVPMQSPTPSVTGKTLLVATTHGATKTGLLVDGKPLTVNVSAWIKPQ